MEITDAAVWHNYTISTPTYSDSEDLASKLIETGVFSSVLTPSNKLYYSNKGAISNQELQLEYSHDFLGLTVTGLKNIDLDDLCDFTKAGFMKCINMRLSQEKVMHLQGGFFSNSIIGSIKPFFIDPNDDQRYLFPMVRVYEIGITQVTFMDDGTYEGDIKEFIDERVNMPLRKLNYITSPFSYVKKHLDIESECVNYALRHNFRKIKEAYISLLKSELKTPNIDSLNLNEEYVDYAGALKLEDSISDIARHIAAIVSYTLKKGKKYNKLSKLDRDSLYGYWQGKPNIFVFEHENQKDTATENSKNSEVMINSILAKSSYYIKYGRSKEHIDHRAFDDYNFFSEPGVCLTLLAKNTYTNMISNKEATYSSENLMMDALVKSDMRDLAAVFFEIKSQEISISKSSINLARIREEIITFEEWLRITSRRFGEIQDYVLSFLHDSDIRTSLNNMNSLLKAKTEIMKLKEAELSERTSKRTEWIFGLIACTSLTPVISPMLEGSKIDSLISYLNMAKYKDGVYLIIIMITVFILDFLLSKTTKK
ncbi:hypothetical protein [Pantoea deleyi]|nr:hypothetical protein [Pantoea deleyi]